MNLIKITKKLVKGILPERPQNSNKGDFGKVLNIVSSSRYIGAGMLTAIAALRAGAGYSIFCSEDDVIKNVAKTSFDLIYKSHNNFNVQTVKEFIEKNNINSIVFGCGVTTEDNVLAFTDSLLDYLVATDITLIIDADGLNCISLLGKSILPKNTILTPHPKELSRLLKVDVEEILNNKEYFINKAQEDFKSIVLLKGHNTLIKDESVLYQNTTGNSALSKSGSGDVLAGIIGGLVAQKITPINAVISGCYLHGLSADIYKKEFSEYSMLASDQIVYLQKAFKAVLR